MDEVLQHFSHHHPLILTAEAPKSGVVCYGCQKPILGSAYSCSECNYFLHNKCAQLSMTIKHPMHSQHPLTLLRQPPYSDYFCDICSIDNWKWFTYHCSRCKFNIHIKCILDEDLDEDQEVVKHDCHGHPLILVQRSALFCCDACFVEDKDLSYKCTTCPFWIHKTCASLPNTIKHSDHHHPLHLAYSLPDKFRNFPYRCNICHRIMHPSYWAYHCADCRYFLHLKCATAKKEPLMLRGENEAEEPNIMHFPMANGSVTKIVQGIVNSEDNDELGTELLQYFSHRHPLHLSKATKDEIICDGCVRPISTPFYDCEQCDFCLHRSCAELSPELQHPSHPQHPLRLKMTDELTFGWFTCHSCNIFCNGLVYFCESCNFRLDVNCATTSLPTTIKHEAHNHPLRLLSQSHHCLCNGCGDYIYPNGFGYGCEACVFYLHNYCARLPRTISHSWDRHPITLTYPPYGDHPDEFICEICEEEMHPNHWIYHCRPCDQSFHYECVRPFQKYSNFKFGGRFKNWRHQHSLTFVGQSKNKSVSPCYDCGARPYDIPLLECAPCNFTICIRCIQRK